MLLVLSGGVRLTKLVHLCRHTHPLGRWPAAKNRHVFAYSSAFIAQATRAPSRALQSCEGSAERSNSFQLERAVSGAALRPPPQASRSRPLLRASGAHQRRTRQHHRRRWPSRAGRGRCQQWVAEAGAWYIVTLPQRTVSNGGGGPTYPPGAPAAAESGIGVGSSFCAHRLHAAGLPAVHPTTRVR